MFRCRVFVTVTLVAGVLAITATDAHAQQRRRAAPPGEAPPPSGPTRLRQPWAGSWQGTLTFGGASAVQRAATTFGVVFDIADTTSGAWSAVTVVGDGARSQALRAVDADGAMRWEASDADATVLVYTARLVSADSIVGTVERRDRSREAGTAGTFVLVRRRTPPRRSGS